MQRRWEKRIEQSIRRVRDSSYNDKISPKIEKKTQFVLVRYSTLILSRTKVTSEAHFPVLLRYRSIFLLDQLIMDCEDQVYIPIL